MPGFAPLRDDYLIVHAFCKSKELKEMSTDAWNDLTLLQLKTELEKRNASTRIATPKTQLVQRLLRIEAGCPLGDDVARPMEELTDPGSRDVDSDCDDGENGGNEEEEEFGGISDDAATLANTVGNAGGEVAAGGQVGDDQDEDFGIESGDEAELEALAVEVESPSLKRPRQSLEGNGSDAKRQCLGTGELIANFSSPRTYVPELISAKTNKLQHIQRRRS